MDASIVVKVRDLQEAIAEEVRDRLECDEMGLFELEDYPAKYDPRFYDLSEDLVE